MLKVSYSSKFKKDLKLMEKRGLKMWKIFDVMRNLQNEIPLDKQYNEHMLQGVYNGLLECHIESDWLLIYKINLNTKDLYFARTGTHSD